MFNDWRYRMSRVCKNAGRWHVIVRYETRDGWPNGYPVLRRLHWWSPRDWIRIPLHLSWERRYW